MGIFCEPNVYHFALVFHFGNEKMVLRNNFLELLIKGGFNVLNNG